MNPAALHSPKWIATALYIKLIPRPKMPSAAIEMRNRALSGPRQAKGKRIAAGTARTYGNQSETEAARDKPAQIWKAILRLGWIDSWAMRNIARSRNASPGM